MHRHADDVNNFELRRGKNSWAYANQWMNELKAPSRSANSTRVHSTQSHFFLFFAFACWSFFCNWRKRESECEREHDWNASLKSACWWCRLERNLRQVSSIYNFATHFVQFSIDTTDESFLRLLEKKFGKSIIHRRRSRKLVGRK